MSEDGARMILKASAICNKKLVLETQKYKTGSSTKESLIAGKSFTYSDPETSSDSEEDALRRLQNSRSNPPPDTLTIQAEDGPTVVGESNDRETRNNKKLDS